MKIGKGFFFAHKIIACLGVAFLASSLLSGCSSNHNASNKVIAEVNGNDVLLEDFQTYLSVKNIPLDDSDRIKRYQDDYLEREALADVIEKQGLADIDRVNAQVRELKKQLLINDYLVKKKSEAVSDAAIETFYSKNINNYQSEQIRVAHILIRTQESMSSEERQAKLNKAQQAYSLAQTDVDFADVAKQMSEDVRSANNGGDLGWIEAGAIDPVFSKTIFDMKSGEISAPFATSFGFHVVKVLEPKQLVTQSLEQVKGDIRYQLQQQVKDEAIKELLHKSKIEVAAS